MREINPFVEVVRHEVALSSENALEILKDYDIIVDGTDNFQTRYLINDASVMTNKTVIHGSIFQFDGQVTVFKLHVGPCYRCLFPEAPPDDLIPRCDQAGIFGALAGSVGAGAKQTAEQTELDDRADQCHEHYGAGEG